MATDRANRKQTPLSVVERGETGKDRTKQDIDMADEARETTILQLRDSLKGLRAQVEQLSRSVVEIGDRAGGKVVGGINAGKDSAVAAVETHPFYAILAAAAAAFLLGRMSVAPERGIAERTYDRLHDMALGLEPRIAEALRSRMR